MNKVTQRKAKQLRKVLVDRVLSYDTDRIAVPMSSGVDSHCALFAALEANKKPLIFSFRMDDRVSRDFRIAENTARLFNLDFIEVLLPSDVDKLVKSTRMLSDFGCKSKTDFECFWPMVYLIRSMHEHKVKVFFTGHGADSLYCMSRKAHQHFAGRFDEFRTQAFSNKTAFQQRFIKRLAVDQLGIDYCPIFYCDEVLKIFLGATHEQMHHPIQKAISRFAFPEYFLKVKVYTHQSFQIGDSGISDHFEKLLMTSLNVRRNKSIVGVFNSLRSDYDSVKSQSPKSLFQLRSNT